MDSDNKNTDKDKEAHNKLEQEIYDALESEPEFEEIPDYKIPSFNDPVEEALPIEDEVYFIEFCNWLSNGYQQLFHKIPAKRDYLIRYYFFPPEQFPEPGDVQKQTWKPISEAALKLKPEPARQRVFHKSPQHHVFLISILESISRDIEKFIETYVIHTNKTLESKYAGGIQKCLELLIGELRIYLERDNTQLLPVLYHNQDYGLMMSADTKKLPYDEDELVFEFGFSKTTSDNFVKQLIKILEAKLTLLNLPLADTKISKANPNKKYYNKKLIDIHEDIVSDLVELLVPYFDKKDHEDLKKLLNGKEITNPLLFKSTGIQLVDIFLRLKEAGKINDYKTVINQWVCRHFEYLEDKVTIRPFKKSYVAKILSMDKLISKDNRISLKSLSLI